MVRGFLERPGFPVNLDTLQPVRHAGAGKDMINPDAVVLLEGSGLVVPERVLVRPAIASFECFGEACLLYTSPSPRD